MDEQECGTASILSNHGGILWRHSSQVDPRSKFPYLSRMGDVAHVAMEGVSFLICLRSQICVSQSRADCAFSPGTKTRSGGKSLKIFRSNIPPVRGPLIGLLHVEKATPEKKG